MSRPQNPQNPRNPLRPWRSADCADIAAGFRGGRSPPAFPVTVALTPTPAKRGAITLRSTNSSNANKHKTTTGKASQSMTAHDDDHLLTIPEAALRMKMSARYVRRLVAERQIAFHRLGRSVRLHPADVDAFVRETRVERMTAESVWNSLRSVA
jgi:excisionase family DNA binding protein